MRIIIVTFFAFNRLQTQMFSKNESFEQIHNALNNICETYCLSSILIANDASFEALSSISKFKK